MKPLKFKTGERFKISMFILYKSNQIEDYKFHGIILKKDKLIYSNQISWEPQTEQKFSNLAISLNSPKAIGFFFLLILTFH